MKILVTAKDVGATLHIVEIVKYIMQEGDNDVVVYAQNPAACYFARESIACTVVELMPANIEELDQIGSLIEYAKSVIEYEKPDVILSGLTTPFDIGVDEVFVYVAKGRVPTFVLQDFWGAVNDKLGILADYYFCLDRLAAELTQIRYNVKTIELGAPKYIQYGKLNISRGRENLREQYGIKNELVVGYFGQALHHMDGYAETLIHFLTTLSCLSMPLLLVYKPHPRESQQDIENTLNAIKKFDINYIVYSQMASYDVMLLCNIICSSFSNCSYDAAYLNFYAEQPHVLPINLLYNKEIRDYCYGVIRLDETPYKRLGVAVNVEIKEELLSTLADLDSLLLDVWNCSKLLPAPDMSVKAALNSLLRANN